MTDGTSCYEQLMEPTRRASRTAAMVAALRARATARGDGLCSDPWAHVLAGEEGYAIAATYEQHVPHVELWLALRTRVIDDSVRRGLALGVRQVVILGAGLDTRGARLGDGRARFFEVDHPASQEDKRRRVAALDGYPGESVRYVGCDFERDELSQRLGAAGFDATSPALIVWEGVVYYLEEVAVRATLETLGGDRFHPESLLIFDYLGKRFVAGDRISGGDLAARATLDGLGEPVRFGINDPLPMLYATGFRHVRSLSFDALCLSLTGTYQRERAFRFQHMCFTSRARALAFW